MAVAQLACTLLAFIALTGGCHRDPVCSVDGKITYRGVVVDHGVINFIGTDNQPHGGPITAEGKFAFDVPPGKYDVIVSAPALPPPGWIEGEPMPELKGGVPEKYSLRHSSNLSLEVSEPQVTHDFDLQ